MIPTTKQEYLDLCIKTSLEGNFPAVNYNGCSYRTDEGKKCIFGLLIPDDKYEKKMEGIMVNSLLEKYPLLKPEFATIDELYYVQRIHDDLSNYEWNHYTFVSSLLTTDLFRGMTPTVHSL